MHFGLRWMGRAGLVAALCMSVAVPPSAALERLDFTVTSGGEDLSDALAAASLLVAQRDEGQTDPLDLFAAARADYARLLGALYAEGHYGATIRITIDGREAAAIAPLDAPTQIGLIEVRIDPGPRFAFARTAIAPLAPGTVLPPDFVPGRPARAGVVEDAVGAAILGWREAGHAKVQATTQDVVADHPAATLSADIRLTPGPVLRFGPATVTGADRMRVQRILKIAGLKTGERFSQTELDRATKRLRRTGIFSSVTLSEGETVLDGGLLPIGIAVAEQKPRRYSVGAEIASLDGLSLTGSWLHRNLLGGGERLQVYGEISNIGAGNSGVDYRLGVTIDRPATLTPDTTASLKAEVGRLDEIDYRADNATFGLGFRHAFSDTLTADAGIAYEYVTGTDPGGSFTFKSLTLPLAVTWDKRDSTTDARNGFYLAGTAKPFYGFGTTGSGIRLTMDGRAYRSFGAEDRFTLAGRLQAGAILGSSLLETPRDALFFSGGGGTVRGHPYRSLGVPVQRASGPAFLIGGTHLVAASVEARVRVGRKLGVVAFADAGQIGVDGFGSGSDFHAGAGLGLRYETGFGPLRLDLAAPVKGDTGSGVQFYIGLGQSF